MQQVTQELNLLYFQCALVVILNALVVMPQPVSRATMAII